MSADEQNTNLQFTVDDGTDDIVVKMWVDQDSEEETVERRTLWRCDDALGSAALLATTRNAAQRDHAHLRCR
jgi:hypothetical protein